MKLITVVLLFLWSMLAVAQPQTTTPILYRSNPQRTGVYDLEPIRELGGVKWEKKVSSTTFGSPMLVDGVLYLGTQVGELYAFDAETGDQKWKAIGFGRHLSAVAAHEGVLYFGAGDSQLHALNADDGSALWSVETGEGFVWTAPLIVEDRLYFGGDDGVFRALSLPDGEEVWQVQFENRIIATPAYHDGRLYVSNSDGLFALDGDSGEIIWSVENGVAWNAAAVHEGQVFAADFDGGFHSFNAATGDALWSFKGGARAWSAPAVTGDMVYVGNVDRFMYALDIETGEPVWTFESEDWAVADPIVVDDVLYFGVGNHDNRDGKRTLYALDRFTGESLWEFQAANRLMTAPAAADNMLYVMTLKGEIYALEGQP